MIDTFVEIESNQQEKIGIIGIMTDTFVQLNVSNWYNVYLEYQLIKFKEERKLLLEM